MQNGVKQKAYQGKLLFTHVGISGPTVLNMSKEMGELLHGKVGLKSARTSAKTSSQNVTIMLDLFPHDDSSVLRKKLQSLLVSQSNKKIKNILSALLPSALVDVVLALAHLNGETPCHSVRSVERQALTSLLKTIPLSVKGLLGKDKAIVSSGGVALSEVNFKTMQSRLFPQLFVAGDMLDINRPSGGYSLQLCWTTGYVAGDSC